MKTLRGSKPLPRFQSKWANNGSLATSSPSTHFKGSRQLPELVRQTACERHFMLFTNFLHTYYFKNLDISQSYRLTLTDYHCMIIITILVLLNII